MTHEALEKKLSSIPVDYLNEVSGYLDFILLRTSSSKSATNASPHREFSGPEEGFWMADSFDVPLDDFKKYRNSPRIASRPR